MKTTEVAVATGPQVRPILPGDHDNGWKLFVDNCEECHGESRRGDGPRHSKVLKAPADLRDPILLAKFSDTELAKVITQGGPALGASKWMPGFAAVLSEQDTLDVIALLRGDSIYLEECFPEASSWVQLDNANGPPILQAFSDGPRAGRRAQLFKSRELVPANATPLGFVMFVELQLPQAGATPVAFIADLSGKVIGIRVGLPAPDNARAQQDLEAVVIHRIPKLPELEPELLTASHQLGMAAQLK